MPTPALERSYTLVVFLFGAMMYASIFGNVSQVISPYLPISPYISLYLPNFSRSLTVMSMVAHMLGLGTLTLTLTLSLTLTCGGTWPASTSVHTSVASCALSST